MYHDDSIQPQETQGRYTVSVDDELRDPFGAGTYETREYQIDDLSELPNIESKETSNRLVSREINVTDNYNDGGKVMNISLEYRDGDDTVWRRVETTYNEDDSVSINEKYIDESGNEVEKEDYIEPSKFFSDSHFAANETYRKDGTVFQVGEAVFADNGSSHTLITHFDEKGEIDYQRLEYTDKDGTSTGSRETFPKSENPFMALFQPAELEHKTITYTDKDGHEHARSYDSIWRGEVGEEYQINIHTTETYTDDKGREHTVEITDQSGRGNHGDYKETVVDHKTGDTTVSKGFYWTDVGNPDTLIVESTVETRHRENGTLESKTIKIYDSGGDIDVKVEYKYDEDGKRVETSERTDCFWKDEDSAEIIVTTTEYDDNGRIDFIYSDDDPGLTVADLRQDVDSDSGDSVERDPDDETESEDSYDDVDSDREE